MKEVLTPDQVGQLLDQLDLPNRARAFEASTQHPFKIQVIDLNLATAKLATDPFKIGFAFKSFFVVDATDTAANVNMLVGTRDSFQSPIPLKMNGGLNLDYPTSEAYLYWSAQASKTMKIIFFVDAQYFSGTQISVTSGGVSISEGSAAALSRVTLVATTAAIIGASLSTRKLGVYQNNTGGVLFVGADATVTNSGATQGINIQPGDSVYWRNTAPLYGYSVLGGDVTVLEEA